MVTGGDDGTTEQASFSGMSGSEDVCALLFFVVGVRNERAHVAQSAEHVLGKDEVSGSIPLVGSSIN